MRHKKQFLIVTPALSLFDAMSNDVLFHFKCLIDDGFDCKIYAEHVCKEYAEMTLNFESATRFLSSPNTILIYHCGVYFEKLPDLLRQNKGKFVLKYHNITPPVYFETYDFESFHATLKGLDQVKWILKNHSPDAIIADSSYNLSQLNEMRRINNIVSDIQSPFVPISGNVPENMRASEETKIDSIVRLLFVGRIVPNKGHAHIIAAIKSYTQLIDKRIKITFAGNLSPNFKNYKIFLDNLIDLGGLKNNVEFLHNISSDKLEILYGSSDIFLCMSEHEGFCVPIVEAQRHRLPIIAWDQAAVAETVGQGGIVLKQNNYDVVATAIHSLKVDSNLRTQLVKLGLENSKRFDESDQKNNFLKFINHFISQAENVAK